MEQQEAIEMYLKSILRVENSKRRAARPVEIAGYLKVAKATVSEMVKKLHDMGLVEHESYKAVKLTAKGKRKAELVLRKYDVIKAFLTEVLKIEVDDEQAHNEACKLEHDFSIESIEKLEKLLQKLKKSSA